MRHSGITFQSMFGMSDIEVDDIWRSSKSACSALTSERRRNEARARSELLALFDDQLPEPALGRIMLELFVPNLADAAFGKRQGRREDAQTK